MHLRSKRPSPAWSSRATSGRSSGQLDHTLACRSCHCRSKQNSTRIFMICGLVDMSSHAFQRDKSLLMTQPSFECTRTSTCTIFAAADCCARAAQDAMSSFASLLWTTCADLKTSSTCSIFEYRIVMHPNHVFASMIRKSFELIPW